MDQLTQELAYEYWHRMLFARFLAENHLLMHPDGVAVSLEECEELAASERAPNGYVLAARYASGMLPHIFRVDDVLLEIEFSPEHRLALERLLASLPRETFLADDSLGWVYQFWQTKKKEEVNKSGEKIDGRTLPAVTQLFTEDYMVQFLLHNTIGAWWCARHHIKGPPGGAGVPAGKAPVALEYLRWKDDGTPAAGSFDSWPKSLKEFTMLDPCCGSGHFLVAGFRILVPLWMHNKGLSAAEACDAVLRENLFGLELDPRCTQIAAFALAMAAWTYPGHDGQPLGYRPLPALNIACSGQGVVGSREDWAKFGDGDARFREGMERLYDLFKQAPELGSLLDPRTVAEDLFALGFDTLKGTVERALKKIEARDDPDRAALGVAAQGIALAASLMSREFTLVVTNVPYLARGKQSNALRHYISVVHPDAKADLATAFVERCQDYCAKGGSLALVSPQNWWYLGSYAKFRRSFLKQFSWHVVASLSEEAWHSFGIRGPKATLIVSSNGPASPVNQLITLDATKPTTPAEKAGLLMQGEAGLVLQADQLSNPDAMITLGSGVRGALLRDYARVLQGIGTADFNRYILKHWEIPRVVSPWDFYQMAPENDSCISGCHSVLRWEDGNGSLSKSPEARICGKPAWGSVGMAVGVTRQLHRSKYTGAKFDCTVAVILPLGAEYHDAISRFVFSGDFISSVRQLDESLSVTESSFGKVHFDLNKWSNLSADGDTLATQCSGDATQWTFNGHPKGSTDPLQVAVARLLDYHWPDREPDDLDALFDADGIVPISSVRGELPAAERLREVLKAASGSEWSASLEHRLLTEAGAGSGTTLDDWLRNSFFEQHCKRFHQRPFIWHLWDGRKDGFSCLVNYHKLTHKLLDNLTHSYVQDWINLQAADAKSGKTGADLRLAAAQALQEKLKLILAGEPPYDVFVRWKPLFEQPIGWNPDLNDGVRMNIRPFVEAGILRKNPNIKWTKDRGKEPQRPKEEYPWFWDGDRFTGDRVNDNHLTNAAKLESRKAKGTRP
jgi:hypothetical protein